MLPTSFYSRVSYTCNRIFLGNLHPSLTNLLRGQRHTERLQQLIRLGPRSRLDRCVLFSGFFTGLFSSKFVDSQPKDTRTYIEDAVRRAIYSQQELGDTKTAEKQLHLALKMAQETMDEKAVIYIYDALANLAMETGRIEDAEKLFVKTTQRLLASGSPSDDNAIIEISIKIADICTSTGRPEMAEIGYQYCLECIHKKMNDPMKSKGDDDEDTTMLLAVASDAYGRFLMSVHRYAEAQKHFDEALDVCRQINGPMHQQTLVLVNNVATASHALGDYATAAHHLRNAANIAGTTGSADLPDYYRNLGIVYLQMGQMEEALMACNRALKTSIEIKDINRESQAHECLQEIQKLKKMS